MSVYETRVLFVILVLIFGVVFSVNAEVTVNPFGIMTSVENEDVLEIEVTLANDGEGEVSFAIDFAKPPEREGRQRGPRRDEVDLEGMMFAVFQDASPYGWLDQLMVGPVVEDDQLDSYRNANDWNNVDFEDYNVVVLAAGGRQGYSQQYQNNYERFCEYIDGGGAAYFETHDPNSPIHSPGDIVNNIQHRTEHGTLVVSPNPEDENYSLFAEICHESQENNWEEGEAIEGSAWLHSAYSEAQFEEGVEDGTLEWYQVLANASNNQPGAIAYGYGRGAVMVLGHPTGHTWQNYTQDGMWGSIAGEILFYLTEMAGPKWIQAIPEEGVIPGQDEIVVDLIFEPIDMEPGVYEMLVEIEFGDEDQPLVQFSAVMSVESDVSNIAGVVTDEETGEVVEGANVDLSYYVYSRISNDEGQWVMSDLPPREYLLSFSAVDYLPESHGFDLAQDDEELNVSLRHSDCAIDPDVISEELDPGANIEINITVANAGNGPLTYTTDRRLLGDANAEPWELRVAVPAGVITQDSRIQGAVFIEDNFYIAGANNRECQIYVLNRDLEIVNQYAQLGEANYGYKDLAWDGELIWGSGERVVYGFTPDGEAGTSFESGITPCNNLAWDSDRDILWVSGTTTDIFGFDREGNRVTTLPRQALRVYGLAYWPDDPDGYQLYIYHKIPDIGDFLITKMDVENSDLMDVVSLQPEAGGAAQGCHITNQYDIYSWVFMGLANDGAQDRIDIWQIDARKDWMAIDPTEGVVEAGEQQDFVVTLDATGLPQALFEGEVVFLHDGVGGETHLPISLQVGEGGGGPEEMVLELANGWNMVSAYVQPDPDGIIAIMADLVEAGTLIMVKNGSGQFYNPQFGFNNIPGWMVDEGYMIKMDGADELTLTGEAVPWNQMIPLDAGWQMVSYYPRQGVNAILAFSGIVDVLLMAKDGLGRFYSPPFGFSNMGNLAPGQGYLLKMDEAAELVYTIEERLAAQSNPFTQPSILPVHTITSENMSLLVLSDIAEGEIGIYTNGNLVGSGVIQDGKCGIAVWGDDPTTSQVDGALKGEALEIQLHDGNSLKNTNFETVLGDDKYVTDGFSVIRILDVTASPEQFGIVDAYPNPFNSNTSITYNLSEAANVEIALYDLAGRQVADLMANHSQAGQHKLTIDGVGLSSGVYVAQLRANGQVSKRKLTLIK